MSAPRKELEDLRRFAVARSLFAPMTLSRALARMAFVQADPIRAPARAQDLILRHRVKGYRAGDGDRVLRPAAVITNRVAYRPVSPCRLRWGRRCRRAKNARYCAVDFAVAQSQKYEGDNRWKWSLWIEGADEDLDRIESVTYRLHPTFPEPIRAVADRASKFQLRCSGWGIFLIPVDIRLKNSETIALQHQLQFAIPRRARDSD